jgi:hypothetical protein
MDSILTTTKVEAHSFKHYVDLVKLCLMCVILQYQKHTYRAPFFQCIVPRPVMDPDLKIVALSENYSQEFSNITLKLQQEAYF